jgi:hypothetical protein
VNLDELARESDFIFVLAPGGEATKHLVGKSFLAAMKKEAVLVNPGRGEFVLRSRVCCGECTCENISGVWAFDSSRGESVGWLPLLLGAYICMTTRVGGEIRTSACLEKATWIKIQTTGVSIHADRNAN